MRLRAFLAALLCLVATLANPATIHFAGSFTASTTVGGCPYPSSSDAGACANAPATGANGVQHSNFFTGYTGVNYTTARRGAPGMEFLRHRLCLRRKHRDGHPRSLKRL